MFKIAQVKQPNIRICKKPSFVPTSKILNSFCSCKKIVSLVSSELLDVSMVAEGTGSLR